MPDVSTLRRRVVSSDEWGKPVRNGDGHPICRWCSTPVVRPRRTFCSDVCVHEWKIRSSPWYVRRQVKKRDKGTCQLCGLNVVKAHREWTRAKPPAADRAARRTWRAARPRWEADHIVPVAEGGGECGLDNYRLLCRPCHVAVTAEWRATRTATQDRDGSGSGAIFRDRVYSSIASSERGQSSRSSRESDRSASNRPPV